MAVASAGGVPTGSLRPWDAGPNRSTGRRSMSGDPVGRGASQLASPGASCGGSPAGPSASITTSSPSSTPSSPSSWASWGTSSPAGRPARAQSGAKAELATGLARRPVPRVGRPPPAFGRGRALGVGMGSSGVSSARRRRISRASSSDAVGQPTGEPSAAKCPAQEHRSGGVVVLPEAWRRACREQVGLSRTIHLTRTRAERPGHLPQGHRGAWATQMLQRRRKEGSTHSQTTTQRQEGGARSSGPT